jgi:FtsP/CotA-like multicopper oxidase with cupredoxin domain
MDVDEQSSGSFFARFLLGAVALVFLPLAAIGIVALLQDDDADAVTATGSTTVDVTLSEFAIKGDLQAPAGRVVLAVTNAGSAEHNLNLEGGPGTTNLASGATEEVDLGELAAGSYTLLCTIPGHAEAGMKATLTVTEGGSGGSGGSGGEDHSGHGGSGEPDYAALDEAMLESIRAFPATTEGAGNQPLEPTVLADGTKEFTLTASIIDWEVEPGKTVKAWAYNNQVPGPEIRVDVGDHVRVVLKNQLPMGTDVHHHGLDLPFEMDGVAPITQELVRSGEEFVYEFDASKPAVAMYHAHHHGQMQVPNGLFGAFYVGEMPLPKGQTISGTTIPADLTIARRITMVLNDAGVIGFSLNGKSFPATEPYAVKNGDWIEVSYFNEGMQIHPMHQHQFPQLVIARDGIPLDQPYWADTVSVAPGERYTVLMNPNQAGTWVWHCHILNHVERESGMFGMVTALVVE